MILDQLFIAWCGSLAVSRVGKNKVHFSKNEKNGVKVSHPTAREACFSPQHSGPEPLALGEEAEVADHCHNQVPLWPAPNRSKIQMHLEKVWAEEKNMVQVAKLGREASPYMQMVAVTPAPS